MKTLCLGLLVFFIKESRFCYEDALKEQLVDVKKSKGTPNLDQLLSGPNTWEIK